MTGQMSLVAGWVSLARRLLPALLVLAVGLESPAYGKLRSFESDAIL